MGEQKVTRNLGKELHGQGPQPLERSGRSTSIRRQASETTRDQLISPHGGKPFKDLLSHGDDLLRLRKESEALPSIYLTERQSADLELLLNGGFLPLDGYMDQANYQSVCHNMRLANGTLWPLPVTLDVSDGIANSISSEQRVSLRHAEGQILAVMTVSDKWQPDLAQEALDIYGTTDDRHPGVYRLLHQTNGTYLGGKIEGLELPVHHTFKHLQNTPSQTRQYFADNGWDRVVAFQTRNPMHRAHVELTKRAMQDAHAQLLIHPVIGPTQPGDIDPFIRTKAHEAILSHYQDGEVKLSLLPLAMRMAGPREALLHAIIRKNYGCTDFIVGRDHAGPKYRGTNQAVYEPLAAQQLAKQYEQELGINIHPFEEMVYVQEQDRYVPINEVPVDATVMSISGTEQRRRLRAGESLPSWFTYPEVARVLERMEIPKSEQGIVIFLTGLSGAGKSTIASILQEKLREIELEDDTKRSREITLLDGDLVRQNLSKGLGFSKEDRDTNVTRVGLVAGLIAKSRGIAITALVSPYEQTREQVKRTVEELGGTFVEVYVDTPLAVVEARDTKGFYASARAGRIRNVTGIDDPYEEPVNPEVRVSTVGLTPEESSQLVIDYLSKQGLIKLSKDF
ncbi:MAG: bifunctional sulfate adenylyltransferase/adenylylsulfate kinase [Patescibacteria group bacterium]|nr:bifunctional sulfate adenylyltransferase/adenylylsulfate kinase [Patescibacteria group bacterium]MDE2588537.1 bifunctional sulfate adenylyltransferase/adenylylsulfate kinase [Patescibacteria group bacterium]